jgi:hypothetical protein
MNPSSDMVTEYSILLTVHLPSGATIGSIAMLAERVADEARRSRH